jgi:hypothetical protein
LVLSPTGSINLGFILREDLLLCSSYLPLGVPNWVVIYTSSSNFSGTVAGELRRRSSHANYAPSKNFSGAVAGRKRISARGVSRFQSFTLLLFCFILFLLASFYKKYKKISSFIVVIFNCLLFSFARMGTPENTKLCDFTSTNNNDFICTPIAPPAHEANFYEIKPALLNLVMKEQFSGASTNDATAHLNNFVELYEMQKYKDVDCDIIKLKLFPFSLRGRAKDWLLSLPRNSINSWVKCKDAFIGKYYPPAKIIALRSDIMKFRQFDNEHVAQAWERMKSTIKNCPTHGLTTWMIIQTFYKGNLLDSAAGGTFMSITLGAATKLLDNMMVNYSEWHTERAP